MSTWPVRGGLLVVGVGRSGTSVATRLAVNLGLRPPPPDDLLPPNEFNPDGYWESGALADRNDELLARWSSTWWTPPPEVSPGMVAGLGGEVTASADAFAAVFGAEPGWVWKDPRLTVLLPFWAPDAASLPVLVPFRDPVAVAASITARDGLTIEQSLAVWEHHTRLLLTALAGRPTLLVDDVALVDDPGGWTEQVHAFATAASLPVAEPATIPADLVTHRVVRSTGDVALTAAQATLLDLCHAEAGAHDAFPVLDLPAAGADLDEVVLPTWYTAARG